MKSWRSRVAAGLAAGAAVLAVTAGTASAATTAETGTVSASAAEWVKYSVDHESKEYCEGSAAELTVFPWFVEKYSDTKCTEQDDGKWTMWALTRD